MVDTKTVDTKLAHALGVARSNYDNLKKQKVAQDVINAVMKADATKWGMKLEEWKELINSRPASQQSAQITLKKENYRTELDTMTNNLLAIINGAGKDTNPDQFLKDFIKARDELVKVMNSFRDFVPINQSERTDWRVLLSISTHAKYPDHLAIYRGGWGDGSKVDRNQYSNGRLVPHAKSTGYKLEQPLPEFQVKQPKKAEQPKQPKK